MTPRPTAEERAKGAISDQNIGNEIVLHRADLLIKYIETQILEAEAAVREECAQIAENEKGDARKYNKDVNEVGVSWYNLAANVIAAAIRKGGK